MNTATDITSTSQIPDKINRIIPVFTITEKTDGSYLIQGDSFTQQLKAGVEVNRHYEKNVSLIVTNPAATAYTSAKAILNAMLAVA